MVSQQSFVEGRLSDIIVSGACKKCVDELVLASEKAEFRSTMGSLQWLAVQTQPLTAARAGLLQTRADVNRLQQT